MAEQSRGETSGTSKKVDRFYTNEVLRDRHCSIAVFKTRDQTPHPVLHSSGNSLSEVIGTG